MYANILRPLQRTQGMPLVCLFVGKVFTRKQICTDIVSVFTFEMLPVLSESFLFELKTFAGRFSVSREWKQGGFHSAEIYSGNG